MQCETYLLKQKSVYIARYVFAHIHIYDIEMRILQCVIMQISNVDVHSEIDAAVGNDMAGK